MSYYYAKRKLTAEQYLAERNRQMRDKQLLDLHAELSRAWLDDYHSRPAKTGFNWAPRWPIQPPEEQYAEASQEIIEGEYEEITGNLLADATASGQGDSQEQPGAGDDPSFTSLDLTPF
jgi:hypothetical protein